METSMKTTWPLAAAMALALAAPAFAAPDPIGYTASDGVNAVAVTTASPLPVTGPTGASAMQVQGTAASAATDSGNPLKIGGVYNTTPPTLTNGQRGDLQIAANGALPVAVKTVADFKAVQSVSATGDGDSGNGAMVVGNYLFGTTSNIVHQRDITVGQPAGTGTTAVAIARMSAAAGANVPSATSAVASNLVVKTAAGNLYGWRVTAGASAGFVLLFNATSAPADGAVTPLDCIPVAANASMAHDVTP